jgi:hypothetical protein
LPPGAYRFETTGEGDADLYVRIGAEPTQATHDCRSYSVTAEEQCDVVLEEEAAIYVMVRGYRECTYDLQGRAL